MQLPEAATAVWWLLHEVMTSSLILKGLGENKERKKIPYQEKHCSQQRGGKELERR